jgi:flagellin-like protein
MLKNKRGLSGIVVAIILIALVLVAAGILWVVIGNLLDSGSKDISGTEKCLGLIIEPTSLECNATLDECTIRLDRPSISGPGKIDTIYLTFKSDTGEGDEIPIEQNIVSFMTRTYDSSEMNVSVSDVESVDVRFSVDVDGEEFPCPGAKSIEKS